MKKLVGLFIVSLVIISYTSYAATFPSYTNYVNDFANLIDANTKTELTQIISELEQKTTVEIAVATITSLEGLSVEDYANQLFNKWGVGKKDKDNGVLILVAKNDRKMRIETGYGVEQYLTDGTAGEIIRQFMVPYFKEGNYSEGILQGTKSVISTIAKSNNTQITGVDNLEISSTTTSSGSLFTSIQTGAFLSIFIIIGCFLMGGSVRGMIEDEIGKYVFTLLWALLFTGIPSFIAFSAFILSNALLYNKLVFIILIIIAVISFIKGFKQKNFLKWIRKNWSSGGGGSYGGWSSGGGGSFGGFGGGSSGGGGASGSW